MPVCPVPLRSAHFIRMGFLGLRDQRTDNDAFFAQDSIVDIVGHLVLVLGGAQQLVLGRGGGLRPDYASGTGSLLGHH